MSVAPSGCEDNAMSIDLNPLLEKAFYVEEMQNESEALERVLETYEDMTHVGGRLFEVVAPAEPDEEWLRAKLVAPLVYFCESEGMPVPRCGPTIVALSIGARLYAIPAGDVIPWASALLHTSTDQLRDTYGTHESETALR
jgi:hypothetical protein